MQITNTPNASNSIAANLYQNTQTEQTQTQSNNTANTITSNLSLTQAQAIAESISQVSPAELAKNVSTNGLTLAKTLELIN